MRALAQSSARTQLRHLFGLMLCSLLFLFAIGAKTAVYRPHQEQTKNLTSAKVWQNKTTSAASMPDQATVRFTFALVLFAVLFTATPKRRSEQSAVAGFSWFYPALSVRPPPTL